MFRNCYVCVLVLVIILGKGERYAREEKRQPENLRTPNRRTRVLLHRGLRLPTILEEMRHLLLQTMQLRLQRLLNLLLLRPLLMMNRYSVFSSHINNNYQVISDGLYSGSYTEVNADNGAEAIH